MCSPSFSSFFASAGPTPLRLVRSFDSKDRVGLDVNAPGQRGDLHGRPRHRVVDVGHGLGFVDAGLAGHLHAVQRRAAENEALLGRLRAAGGSVVNIIDVYAERPLRGHSVYCISKAGLAMMTRALARELGPEVRVNGVSPGAILWPESTPAEMEKNDILGRTALGRLGEPGDIASAVAYLALDAPYVTGQILAVDGGRSLNI
mgnify:CR=1 FL=1